MRRDIDTAFGEEEYFTMLLTQEHREFEETPTQERVIGRREFLQAGIVPTIAMLLRRESVGREPPQLTADELLQYVALLPMPDIDSKDRLLVPDAKHAMIHIRQSHWTPNLSQKAKIEVKECQEQIERTLELLMRDPKIRLRKVFNEGKMTKGEPKPSKEGSELANEWEYALRKEQDTPMITRYGAVDKLLYYGKIEELGIERRRVHERAGIAIKTGENVRQYVFEDRENAALDILAESRERIGCVVYGSDHDWINNVVQWNSTHTDKFELLTLTPNAIAYRRR